MPLISRRTALAALAATSTASIAAAVVASERLPVSSDPIFALIKEHRFAVEARVWSGEDDDEFPDVVAEADKALTRLCAAEPTTLAGCAAMLRHVMEAEDMDELPAPISSMLSSLMHTLDRLAAA